PGQCFQQCPALVPEERGQAMNGLLQSANQRFADDDPEGLNDIPNRIGKAILPIGQVSEPGTIVLPGLLPGRTVQTQRCISHADQEEVDKGSQDTHASLAARMVPAMIQRQLEVGRQYKRKQSCTHGPALCSRHQTASLCMLRATVLAGNRITAVILCPSASSIWPS